VLCPVRRLTTALEWVLLKDISLAVVPGSGPELSSRACLRVPLRLRQLARCWLTSQRLSLCRTSHLETPKAGSGPRKPRMEPPLASSLATSLPRTLACPGTQ
jgi:hypothetical protein